MGHIAATIDTPIAIIGTVTAATPTVKAARAAFNAQVWVARYVRAGETN
jgi:hypothetical protein